MISSPSTRRSTALTRTSPARRAVLDREDMLDKMRVNLQGGKDMKVKIAARLHVQLHSLKILEGKPIHETVTEALEAYFRAAEAGPPTADTGKDQVS